MTATLEWPLPPGSVLRERWERISQMAKDRRLAALIVYGRRLMTLYGDVCYLTGYIPFSSSPAVAVLFPDEPPILLLNPRERLFAQRIGLSDLTSIAEPATEQLVELLRSRTEAGDRLGLVGMAHAMPVEHYLGLATLSGRQLIDASEEYARQKAIKRAPEILLIEDAYSMADEAYSQLSELAVAGAEEWEIVSELERLVRLRGALYTNVMVLDGAMVPRFPTKRRLRNGEMVTCIVEFAAPNGYWVEKGGMVAIGHPPDEQLQLYRAAENALRAGTSLLTSGTKVSTVVAAMTEEAVSHGFHLGHLCGHGVGVDHDRPTIKQASEERLDAGMVVALHPHLLNRAETAGAKVSEQYLIQPEGARPFSRLPVQLQLAPAPKDDER